MSLLSKRMDWSTEMVLQMGEQLPAPVFVTVTAPDSPFVARLLDLPDNGIIGRQVAQFIF